MRPTSLSAALFGLVAGLLAVLALPGGAAAQAPHPVETTPGPAVEDEVVLPDWLTEPDAPARPPLLPLRVGSPPPSGKRMVRAGLASTITGAILLAGGSGALTTIWRTPEPYGVIGFIPLVLGGGFTTMGALLLHFGLERRWARVDWQVGRPRLDRRRAPHPGSGLLLAGPLTLAGGATVFAWAMADIGRLQGPPCPEPGDPFCLETTPQRAALLVASSSASVLLGVTLTVLGALNRSRYIDWRRERGLAIELRPSGWATTTSLGLGLRGRF